jgi:hypothetical protein
MIWARDLPGLPANRKIKRTKKRNPNQPRMDKVCPMSDKISLTIAE